MTDKYNDFFRPYSVWFKDTISNKEELEEGDIVTLRNGDRLVYLGNEEFADLGDENSNYVSDVGDLKDDLSYDGWDNEPDYDVVKVERPATYYTAFEREDKAREMTIKEISKELGYEVKVVKEK